MTVAALSAHTYWGVALGIGLGAAIVVAILLAAVSYTHLTLPTILRV